MNARFVELFLIEEQERLNHLWKRSSLLYNQCNGFPVTGCCRRLLTLSVLLRTHGNFNYEIFFYSHFNK